MSGNIWYAAANIHGLHHMTDMMPGVETADQGEQGFEGRLILSPPKQPISWPGSQSDPVVVAPVPSWTGVCK